MQTFVVVVALLVFGASPLTAMPVASLASEDGFVTQVRKGGGSSRSGESGRFVTRGYATKDKSTTVTHRKY